MLELKSIHVNKRATRSLIHKGWDKMAAVFQTANLNSFLLYEKYLILIKIAPYGLINSLRLSDAYMRHLVIIGSDNGLSPGRRQAIIWTNAGILLIEPLGKNFSEILIEILTFSFQKMRLKVSSAKWRPFYLGLNVLTISQHGLRWWLWHQTGKKPLSEPMVASFTDAYMYHSASMR